MTEYIHERTYVSVARTVNVIDGPIRVMRHSSKGRKFRIDKVVVTYYQRSEEWHVQTLSLHGIVLKADGSDSKLDTWERSVHEWKDSDSLEWLRDLIDGIRPVGEVTLPFDVNDPEEVTP